MLYFLSGKYRNGLMDGSDGWMDGHTFSPTTLIQKHLPSGAQCAKSWWNLHSENSHLWDFPLLKIPPGSNLRISTLGFSHIESDLLVIGGPLRIKKIFIVEINTVENPMVKIPPITSTPQI